LENRGEGNLKMSTTEKSKLERGSIYVLRVTDKSNANIKNLVEQAEADEDVEILAYEETASRESDMYDDEKVGELIKKRTSVQLPVAPVTIVPAPVRAQSCRVHRSEEPSAAAGLPTNRPRNSFLVRVTKKKKRRRKRGGGKSRGKNKPDKVMKPKGFIEKLKQDTEEGKVECFQVEPNSPTGKVERQLSHKDLLKISTQKPVGPKLLAAFQSSPAILPSRSSYLDAMNQTRPSHIVKVSSDNVQRNSMAGRKAEMDRAQNVEIARVQREYIEALESEVKRIKVRADLIDRQLKMEIGRLEVLLHSRDEELVHKDLLTDSLRVQNRNMQNAIRKKDDVIDIQGQYVTGLEVENKALARKLGLNAIPMVPRSEETDSLRELYRRISSEKLDEI